jgi:hypothetical protein
MWMPLAFWAIHRAVDRRSFRSGVLAGLFLFLQIVTCVYYGVFLSTALAVFAAALAATDFKRTVAAAPGLAAGAIVAAALTLPYAAVYLASAETLGARDLAEVAAYSARPVSYLASPPQNWLWGWTSERWGGPELNLFLGLAAMALSATAIVLHRSRRLVALYAIVCAYSLEMSLGANGRLYPWLVETAPALLGLRSPSRFAILVCMAVAMLAGLGAQAVHQRLSPRRPRWAALVYAAALLALLVDYRNTGMHLMDLSRPSGSVYEAVVGAGPGVLAELPMPRADMLAGHDPEYEYWSTAHWMPLVNGYSGYYPAHYIRTLELMTRFPDGASIERLRALNVRYVVVHHAFYEPDDLSSLLLALGGRSEMRWRGQYTDPVGKAELFVLEP